MGTALGPKRENSIEDNPFLSVLGDCFSANIGIRGSRRRIGGGATESNEEARMENIDRGSVTGVVLLKTAGSASSSAHSVTLKSRDDGSDSRSASSSSFSKTLNGMELILEKSGGEVIALREDVRVLIEMFGEWTAVDALRLRGSD